MAAEPQIRKFTRPQIIYHWIFSFMWVVLALTGLTFLWRGNPQGGVFGLGLYLQGSTGQVLRLIHRVASVIFMASPLIWAAMEPGSLLREVIGLITIRKGDWRWLLVAPRHYFAGRPPLPPQGKYNAGQKLNEWIVLVTYVGLSISGLILWLGRGTVSPEVYRWMLLVHDLLFWIGLLMATLHMYLTLLHPFTRQALPAMRHGFVSLGYARLEHPLWVAQEMEAGRAEIKDAPAHD